MCARINCCSLSTRTMSPLNPKAVSKPMIWSHFEQQKTIHPSSTLESFLAIAVSIVKTNCLNWLMCWPYIDNINVAWRSCPAIMIQCLAGVIAKQSDTVTRLYLKLQTLCPQKFLPLTPGNESEEEDEKSDEVLMLEYQISCWREYTEYLTDIIHDEVQTNRRMPTAEERNEKRPHGALFTAQSEAQSPISVKRQCVLLDVEDFLYVRGKWFWLTVIILL